MKDLANKIISELSAFSPVITQASTGSIYISFTGSKVREVRISNHSGHKLKRNVWELRTDAMSKRDGSNRIYNSKSVSQLIKDFK